MPKLKPPSPLDILPMNSTITIDTGTLCLGSSHELSLILEAFGGLVNQQAPQELVLRAEIRESRRFDLRDG